MENGQLRPGAGPQEPVKQVWKPTTLLGPIPPVLVSCRLDGKDNIFTVGWTGIVNSRPAMTYISVRPERYSYHMIERSGVFAVNLANRRLVRATDWCGVRSGKNIDKFKECNLTKEQAKEIDVPLVAQSPVNLECRVEQAIPLGSHTMFLAKILAVHVGGELLTEKGELRIEKAGLVAYAHGSYFELGKTLGTFGYSVRKKGKTRS